jgi:hypothetical protein
MTMTKYRPLHEIHDMNDALHKFRVDVFHQYTLGKQLSQELINKLDIMFPVWLAIYDDMFFTWMPKPGVISK